jgi:replicative DNA helicase
MVQEADSVAKVATIAEWLDEIVADYDVADRLIAANKPLGPVIPFSILSEKLGGYWPAGVIGIHAAPGTGKTALAICAAMAAGCRVTYVTAEMSAVTIVQRMIAASNGDYLGRLRRGQITASSMQAKLDALAAKHPQFTIIDASSGHCDSNLLRATVAKTETQALFVDSIHAYAEQAYPNLDEYPAMNRVVRELRALAMDRQIPVVTLQERSRALKNGGLSAGAGSRKLEYSAEVVLELDVVPGGTDHATRINMTVSKNRQGPRDVVIGFEFDGATQRFCEVKTAWSSLPMTTMKPSHAATTAATPEIAQLPTFDEYFNA